MKKKLAVLAAVLMASAVLGGCAQKAPETERQTQTQTETRLKRKPKRLQPKRERLSGRGTAERKSTQLPDRKDR